MEEKMMQMENVQEYSDQDIVFETDAVQKNYQNRMKDNDLNLSIPEENEKAAEENLDFAEYEVNWSADETKKAVDSIPEAEKVDEALQPQNSWPDIPSLSEEDYYAGLATMDIGDEWYEENYGFGPEELIPPVYEQVKKNEKSILEAGKLGADIEDVADMLDFNATSGKESIIKQKEIDLEPNPWLKRELQREQKNNLNILEVFGKQVEQANLTVSIKGKEVYKGITKPFRKLSRVRHKNRAEKLEKRLELQKQKLGKIIEKADEAAAIKRNQIRRKKGNDVLEVEAYRTVRAQKRINQLGREVNNLTVAKNTEIAMIERSIAYEARLETNIEKSKLKKQENKELLDRQPTKEERKVLKKEQILNKELLELENDTKKLDTLKRIEELEELTRIAKEERREIREEIQQMKKSVLDTKIEEAELAGNERAMEKALKTLEKYLVPGKSVEIEAETGKFKAYKELTGELRLERWNEKKEMYEATSRLDTVSVFAKDQKLITRKIDEMFEGEKKDSPKKELEDHEITRTFS